ncbi:MAG: hypothetical protein M3298_00760, partial [Thermoproteota archaeon]|nr:hypothetical protein [Thermoproteota archaeon]
MADKQIRDNYYTDNRRLNGINMSQEDPAADQKGNSVKPLAKLLVVDDDPDITQVLQKGLRRNNFLVTSFTDPDEALKAFKSDPDSYCLV